MQAFVVVVGAEGGLTTNPADPGNWTMAGCKGECRGTKYGISALAYPGLDIASLTLDQAQRLYHADYWQRIGGDDMPPALALILFDGAVNTGVAEAVRCLQLAVGAKVDGVLGPLTMAATKAAIGTTGIDAVCAEVLAQRLVAMAALPQWRSFALGWARRLTRLPFQARQMTATV
jgi:lysozyme family protein